MTNDLSLAVVRAGDQDNLTPGTLVGATIGPWAVRACVRPGRRWDYVLVQARSGALRRLRGHEVVRLARQARMDGLPVVMPQEPWRDEDAT